VQQKVKTGGNGSGGNEGKSRQFTKKPTKQVSNIRPQKTSRGEKENQSCSSRRKWGGGAPKKHGREKRTYTYSREAKRKSDFRRRKPLRRTTQDTTREQN